MRVCFVNLSKGRVWEKGLQCVILIGFIEEEDPPTVGDTIPWAGILACGGGREGSKLSIGMYAFIALSDFSTTMGCNLKLKPKISHFPLGFVSILITATGKATKADSKAAVPVPFIGS